MYLAPVALPKLTLTAVAVRPANGTGALPEEAPGVGLLVWTITQSVLQSLFPKLHDMKNEKTEILNLIDFRF